MKLLTTYCDHCRKLIPEDNNHYPIDGCTEVSIDFRNSDILICDVDLCSECMLKLQDSILVFLNRAGKA